MRDWSTKKITRVVRRPAFRMSGNSVRGLGSPLVAAPSRRARIDADGYGVTGEMPTPTLVLVAGAFTPFTPYWILDSRRRRALGPRMPGHGYCALRGTSLENLWSLMKNNCIPDSAYYEWKVICSSHRKEPLWIAREAAADSSRAKIVERTITNVRSCELTRKLMPNRSVA